MSCLSLAQVQSDPPDRRKYLSSM